MRQDDAEFGPWREANAQLRRYIREHLESGQRVETLRGYVATEADPSIVDQHEVVGRSYLPEPKSPPAFWMKCFREDQHGGGGAGHKVGWVVWYPDGRLRLLGRDCGERHYGIDRHRAAVDDFTKIDAAERAKELREKQLRLFQHHIGQVMDEAKEARRGPECVYHAKLGEEFARNFRVEQGLIIAAFEGDHGEMFIDRQIEAKTLELMSTDAKRMNANERTPLGPIRGWGDFVGGDPATKLDDAVSLLRDVERRCAVEIVRLSDEEQISLLKAGRTALQRTIDAMNPLEGAAVFLSPSNSPRMVRWFTAHPATTGRAKYEAVARGFRRIDSDGEVAVAQLPDWFRVPELTETRKLAEGLHLGDPPSAPRRSRQLRKAA